MRIRLMEVHSFILYSLFFLLYFILSFIFFLLYFFFILSLTYLLHLFLIFFLSSFLYVVELGLGFLYTTLSCLRSILVERPEAWYLVLPGDGNFPTPGGM